MFKAHRFYLNQFSRMKTKCNSLPGKKGARGSSEGLSGPSHWSLGDLGRGRWYLSSRLLSGVWNSVPQACAAWHSALGVKGSSVLVGGTKPCLAQAPAVWAKPKSN